MYLPRWSPDGRRIAVLSHDGARTAAVARRRGRLVGPTDRGRRADTSHSWTPEGTLVVTYLLGPEAVTANVRTMELDPDSGRLTPLPGLAARSWVSACGGQAITVDDADGSGGDPELPQHVSAPSSLVLVGYDGNAGPTKLATAPPGTNVQDPRCSAARPAPVIPGPPAPLGRFTRGWA